VVISTDLFIIESRLVEYISRICRGRLSCFSGNDTLHEHKKSDWQVTLLAIEQPRRKSYPRDAHCCHMGTAIKHSVPDWVKQSFVIFDIQAL